MPRFPVDDGFHSHPKAWAASLAALGLWTVAGSWSNDQSTDGFIPDHMIPLLSRSQSELVKELCDAGLWRRARGGYQYHQWTADGDGTPRNITSEEAMARRAKKSSGGSLGNHRRWHVNEGRPDPHCGYCQGSDRTSDRSTDRTTNRSTEPPSDSGPTPPSPSPSPEGTRSLGDQSAGDQSVRARAREAIRWLAATYGLTDSEASAAWAAAEHRAKDPIKNPKRYLARMVDNGTLADIVETIQTRPAPPPEPTAPPALRAVPDPPQPVQPEGPDPYETGPAKARAAFLEAKQRKASS